MSLYNMLFGVNQFAPVLLEMLKIKHTDIPRFRDCYLSKDATEIIVHTRTGGGNRDDYEAENHALTLVPGYIHDEDDDFDSTYANFHFAVPKEYAAVAELIQASGDTTTPVEKWQALFAGLDAKKSDDPAVKKALEVGGKIMDAIQSGKKIIEV